MVKTEKTKNRFECTFSSSLHLVDRIIEEYDTFLTESGLASQSEFNTVARELILNAIEHGNKNDPLKTVYCQIDRLENGQISLLVRDQGTGFDTSKATAQSKKPQARKRQRGFAMIHALSDTLEFARKGAEVKALITAPARESFRLIEKDKLKIIEPSGNLTATVAEPFRATLVDLLDQGHADYCLDFRNVKGIDSICFSVMVSFAKMVAKESPKKKVRIDHMSESIQRLLVHTRLDRVFQLSVPKGEGHAS